MSFYLYQPSNKNYQLFQADLFQTLSQNNPLAQGPAEVRFNGLDDPRTPFLPQTISSNKLRDHVMLRDFLMFRLRAKSDDLKTEIHDKFMAYFDKHRNPDYAIYQAPSSNHIIVLVKVSEYITTEQSSFLVDQTLDTLKLSSSISMTKPDHKFNKIEMPLYNNDQSKKKYYKINYTGQKLPVDLNQLNQSGLSLTNNQNNLFNPGTNPTQGLTYSDQVLDESLTIYLNDVGQDTLLNNQNLRSEFFSALIVAHKHHTISDDFIASVIPAITPDPNIQQQLTTEYSDQEADILANNAAQLKAPMIGEFLPLDRHSSADTETLSQQFVNSLGDQYNPNPEINLADAGRMIAEHYPPHLLDEPGKNRDRVVIFNPLTGLWTHDDDLFRMLLTVIKPYATKAQVETMVETFAAQAANAGRVISPYNGSRYLLFNNGMLDIVTMNFHQLNETRVKKLHFIERSKLNIDFVFDPQIPILANERQCDGGDWNPKDFISAYGNNDAATIQYLLFGLSLGLFGSHNFGVHFDIQGESRWGKTTLSEIYNGLYDNHVQIISFSALNENFPFTSYPINTSVIWVKESNIGTKPLDDEHGTVIYDGLADNQVRFNVKGTDDIVLSNPPQVYIDGTQLIQASEITTGPAGRTLAYKLPKMTTALRNQAYANNINNDLHNPQVLQWLVWQMIQAYRSLIPQTRQADLKLNLSLAGDLNLLPPFAKKWRDEFAANSGGLDGWFNDQIEPFLYQTTDDKDPKATLLHPSILYMFYRQAYRADNPQDRYFNHIRSSDSFWRQLQSVLSQHGWHLVEKGSNAGHRKNKVKQVNALNKLNFNIKEYEKSYELPLELKDAANLPEPFHKQKPHWVALIKDHQ